jgi:hypothetical protein
MGQATPGGIVFGPNATGKRYLSTYHHRGSGSRQHKSIWAETISPSKECCLFYTAERENWQCSDQHYWGILDGGKTPLGKGGERLSKFPCPSNTTDPWHGYPVFSGDDAPPDDFIEQWIARDVISKTTGRKIQKGRL